MKEPAFLGENVFYSFLYNNLSLNKNNFICIVIWHRINLCDYYNLSYNNFTRLYICAFMLLRQLMDNISSFHR